MADGSVVLRRLCSGFVVWRATKEWATCGCIMLLGGRGLLLNGGLGDGGLGVEGAATWDCRSVNGGFVLFDGRAFLGRESARREPGRSVVLGWSRGWGAGGEGAGHRLELLRGDGRGRVLAQAARGGVVGGVAGGGLRGGQGLLHLRGRGALVLGRLEGRAGCLGCLGLFDGLLCALGHEVADGELVLDSLLDLLLDRGVKCRTVMRGLLQDGVCGVRGGQPLGLYLGLEVVAGREGGLGARWRLGSAAGVLTGGSW